MHVEIWSLTNDGKRLDGQVRLKNGRAVADESLRGLLSTLHVLMPGVKKPIDPGDGEQYLKALRYTIHGSYCWATAPIED